MIEEEQKQIALSICIPTYNRANLLRNTLLSLAPQVDVNSDFCEVIVSDNASEDDTKNIVVECQQKYKNIKYFRNESNLGGRQNIWKVTTYATGKYIWILGDDDMPTPGAIEYILSILLDPDLVKNLKLLVLNSTKVKQEFTKGQISWGEMFSFSKFDTITSFTSGLDIFRHFPIKELGFISALVVERESWLHSSYLSYPKSWMYAHLISIVEIAALGASCYSPRICTLGLVSDQSWCLDRGVFTYSYEFPFLYDLAVSKGFSRQKADDLLGKMWLPTTKQYIKMLMFSEIYRPSIEKMEKYHSQLLYFWFLILPIHYLLSVKFLSVFTRQMAYRVNPKFLVPRSSIDFEA